MKQVIGMGARYPDARRDGSLALEPCALGSGYHQSMTDGPNIARVAAIIGETSRAKVLSVLMADRALTATELANHVGVTKQTLSAHLAKLLDARLIAVEAQ